MRILLCNDDGYQAPGIVALHAPLYVSSALEGGSNRPAPVAHLPRARAAGDVAEKCSQGGW